MTSFRKTNRLQVYALFAVFIVPMVLGALLYHYHAFFNLRSKNYGTLVTPAIYRQDISIADAKKRKWQIAYMPQNCMSESSQKIIYTLHQVQKALGKDSDRVTLTLIHAKKEPLKSSAELRQLFFTQAQFVDLQKIINHQAIFLVDPIGNIFMYYAENDDAMKILKDMKHVLGVSQLG